MTSVLFLRDRLARGGWSNYDTFKVRGTVTL